jgi:glyoxylase-like metal-dependent hydrolase (beta-lactamase superfamily II)
MRQLYPDLWQTSLERPVPSEPRAAAHAYLLVRDGGNLLFYSPGREAIGKPDDEADLERIGELGGITHQILAHWHEASPSLRKIKERFGSMLAVHERDAEAVKREGGTVPDVTFGSRQVLLGDVEMIPTPGHTAGSASFLYRSPHGRTYLFVGDTIVPDGDSWLAFAFEDEKGQPSLRRSLELLRGLDTDVVLAAGALGDETFKEIVRGAWPAAVDAAIARLV